MKSRKFSKFSGKQVEDSKPRDNNEEAFSRTNLRGSASIKGHLGTEDDLDFGKGDALREEELYETKSKGLRKKYDVGDVEAYVCRCE